MLSLLFFFKIIALITIDLFKVLKIIVCKFPLSNIREEKKIIVKEKRRGILLIYRI